MQPMDSIASRATARRSQPSASATTALSASPSLPEPMKTTLSVSRASAKIEYTRGKPTRNGSDTESLKVSGAAPVPPSPPSTVMKSTPRRPSAMVAARSCQNCRSPTADLIPTGSPVACASSSTQSSMLSTSWNSRVPRGADAVLALAHAADLGDLGRDLRRRQHTAQARLGALAELDLQGADRRGGHEVGEPGEVEGAVEVPAPEVGGADLEHEVPAVPVVL